MTRMITRFVKGVACVARDLARDTHGAIMAIAAFIVAFAVIGMMALSIDHGINLTRQSDLDSKLFEATKLAAKQYSWYRVRNACEVSDIVNSDATWIVDATISNEAALEMIRTRLEDFMEQPMVGEGGLPEVTVTDVDVDTNDNDREIFRAVAQIEQVNNFGKQGSVVEVESKVTLPFGGDAITGVAPEVLQFVFSLDKNSKDNLGGDDISSPLEEFAEALQDCIENSGLISMDAVETGLQLGNRPLADSGDLGDGAALPYQRHPTSSSTPKMGFSGEMYDSDRFIQNVATGVVRQADESRKYPFVGEFYAQKTRRCDADPVWTYDTEVTGSCWEAGVETCDGNNCCAASFGNWLGTSTDCNEYSCPDAGCYWDGIEGQCELAGDPAGCPTPEVLVERECCDVRNDRDIVRGVWYPSCPHTATEDDELYQDASNYIRFYAEQYATLDEVELEDGDLKVRAIGIPSLSTGGTLLAGHQEEELLDFKVSNTDRAWVWACDTLRTVNGTTSANPDGAYGAPYGTLGGRPLVDDTDQTAIMYDPVTRAVTTDLNMACLMTNGGPTTANHYRVEFRRIKPDGSICSGDLFERGCDIPEGYYTITAELGTDGAQQLKGPDNPRNHGVAPIPPGGTFTVYTAPSDAGWAWRDIANAGSANGEECPKFEFGPEVGEYRTNRRLYNDANGAPNTRLADYVSGERIAADIPGEEFQMASFAIEAGRDEDGRPVMTMFDEFDEGFLNTWQDFLDTNEWPTDPYVECAGNQYPNFCGANLNSPTTEDNFWWMNTAEPDGVAHFKDTTVSPVVIGVVPVDLSGGVLRTWLHGGDPYPRKHAPVSSLATPKVTGTPCGGGWCGNGNGNIPFGTGAGHFQSIINALTYDPYTIHCGHGCSQGALVKAAYEKLVNYAAGKNTGMVYIGSCPTDETFTSSDLLFTEGCSGGQEVPWFANSNIGASGGPQMPGIIVDSSLSLRSINNPGNGSAAQSCRSDTLTAFTAIAEQVGYFNVITDDTCPEFQSLTCEGGECDGDPNDFCNFPCDVTENPELCAAQILCPFAKVDIREVGSAGLF